jgi:hypothetical protein
MKLKESAVLICEIFKETFKEKDFEWKWHVITVLMKLGYDEPKELYYYYVIDFLNDDKWSRSFLLLIWYGLVDRSNSLPLLTDYYCKCFAVKDKQMQVFLNNSIASLISCFHYRDFDFVLSLIKMVYTKDKEAGKYLQEDIISFMNSNWIQKGEYNKELITVQQDQVLNAIEPPFGRDL